jgi:hypothetical protein
MRVTVKIGNVEVTIERPNFKEAVYVSAESQTMKDVVIPTLSAAIEQAKELYNLKSEHV